MVGLEDLKSWKRLSCIISVIGALQFIFVSFIGMLFYPDGYEFLGHYLSDLGTTVSRNGLSNMTSRVFFVIACTWAGISLITFWIVMPTLFLQTKIAKYLSFAGSILGVMSSPLLALISFYAADVYLDEHIWVTMYFFLFFAMAIMIYSVAILLNNDYENIYGIVGVIFSIIIVLFIFGYFSPYNVLMQKVVVYGFCLWTSFQATKIWKDVRP
ncbi:MAG: hypothetical protein ACTSUT_04675 [Promethearchaeota archaeon]